MQNNRSLSFENNFENLQLNSRQIQTKPFVCKSDTYCDQMSKVVIDRNQYFDRERNRDPNKHVTVPRPRPNRNTALTDADTFRSLVKGIQFDVKKYYYIYVIKSMWNTLDYISSM